MKTFGGKDEAILNSLSGKDFLAKIFEVKESTEEQKTSSEPAVKEDSPVAESIVSARGRLHRQAVRDLH